MKVWCIQISKNANQILDRFLPYEARAEICQKFGWLFGRFEDTKKIILRLNDLYYTSFLLLSLNTKRVWLMCSLGRINIFNLVFTIQRQLTKMDLHSRTLGGSQTTTLFVGVTFVYYIPCLYCLIHNTICTFREYVSSRRS